MIKNILYEIRYYIQDNWIVCLIAIYALAMVIPFLPFSFPLYYGMIGCLFLYMLSRANMKLNIVLIWFYMAAAVSILINNPPAVFRSWERLCLLILVTGAVFSLFSSANGNRVHFKIFKVTLWLFVIIGSSSLLCYLLNINGMTMWNYGGNKINLAGGFGGLTQQSMILAPLSAFAFIFLLNKLLSKGIEPNFRYLLICLSILCAISILLSASRSAFLAAIIGTIISLYLKQRNHLTNFIKNICIVIIIAIGSYPLYSDYASGLLAKQEANEQSGGTFASRNEKWTNRISEFEQDPLFGIGFASISLNTREGAHTGSAGVVEPGSTWLAVLSMTGILGAIPIFILVFTSLNNLYNKIKFNDDSIAIFLFSLLMANIVHQFAEGYALAGGSYLCFFFWLLLGVAYIYGQVDAECEEDNTL